MSQIDQVQTPDGRPAEPLQLNLGAAKTYIPGFVNIDIDEKAELTLDLGTDPLPFADDSVTTVVSLHTLEHVSDYLFALSEIHRVLRHDGELLLSLPYVTLTEHHLVNPYHRHNFSERSFDFFDPSGMKGSAGEESATAFRKAFVSFNYIGSFGRAPQRARTWARRHMLNVVRQFDIGLVAIKDPGLPVEISPARGHALEASLAELKTARTPYPAPGAPPEGPASTRQAGTPGSRAPAAAKGRWESRYG